MRRSAEEKQLKKIKFVVAWFWKTCRECGDSFRLEFMWRKWEWVDDECRMERRWLCLYCALTVEDALDKLTYSKGSRSLRR